MEIRSLMEDVKAEIPKSSVHSFQMAHPAAAAESTEWLRASLASPSKLHRPPARRLPEIVDRPSIVVLPFDDLTESLGISRPPARGHRH